MASPRLTPLAAAVLHAGSPERVLEIECGEGDGTLFLAREFPSARIRGVDRDESAVRRASARIGLDPEGRVAFKTGRPRRLPFPDDQFDLLVAVDARPAAAESARVLRRGGFLALVSTSRGKPLGGFSGQLASARLRRCGFVAIWSELAGDGSFSVERLGDGLATPPSV